MRMRGGRGAAAFALPRRAGIASRCAETVASQERWTKNMREDIDELADRTCKLLDLVTDPERGDSKA